MATRIGGPMTGTPGVVPPCTWASMRSPLVLNLFNWGQSYTRYSRQYPASTASPPKFFTWESMSLLRREPWRGPGGGGGDEPYHIIWGLDDTTLWSAGNYYPANKSINNTDFLELVGQPIATDIGTFTITEDAHDFNTSGQVLDTAPPVGTKVNSIGKMTPI